MQPYTILMLVFAAMIFIFALLIYKGQTGLVRTFDRVKVKDAEAYAKFIGKSVALIGLVVLISGVSNCFVDTVISLIILLVGAIAAFIVIGKKSKAHYK